MLERSTEKQSDFWSVSHYLDLVRLALGGELGGRRSGVIREASDALKIHSTYLSQILNEKAHLSQEQALRFAQWAGWNAIQSEFFLLLVLRDRSGTQELFAFYQQKLEAIRIQQRQVSARIQDDTTKTRTLSDAVKAEYYASWRHQAVHFMTQIPTASTASAIANALSLSERQVIESLTRLEEWGLVQRVPAKRDQEWKWECRVPFLHIGRDSPAYARSMASFRIKAADDFAQNRDPKGMFYTSVCVMDQATAVRVQEEILKVLSESRRWIEAAPSEQLQVLNIDFYRLDQTEN